MELRQDGAHRPSLSSRDDGGLFGWWRDADSRARHAFVAAEVFADRAYEPDGSLESRRKQGSVIHDTDAVVARAVRMVKERTVVAIDGSVVPLEADTICVHGDTPGSDELAAKIRAGLEAAGVTVKAIGQP